MRRVAIGLKAHSGWAALVAIGENSGRLFLADRRRIDLVVNPDDWLEKQPYHAGENLDPAAAARLIRRAVATTDKRARAELGAALSWFPGEDEIVAVAILTPSPMPEWTVAEILAVHIRMHKAEGVMYPRALSKAAAKLGLPLVEISEKTIVEEAREAFGSRYTATMNALAALGKTAGPPWGKDQKTAALAAAIALNQ